MPARNLPKSCRPSYNAGHNSANSNTSLTTNHNMHSSQPC
jgi:hypothetical protein